MKKIGLKQLAPLVGLTIVLLVTALVDLAVASEKRKAFNPVSIPSEVDGWTSTDVLKQSSAIVKKEVAKFYNTSDNKLTWRKYEKNGQPPMHAIIQQATNFENIHDVYTCLQISEASPKRIGVVYLSPTEPVVLVELKRRDKSLCALFWYQSQAMSAVYPAETPGEQALLALIGRVPCQLIELTTPITSSKEEAAARLTAFAAALKAQALPSTGANVSQGLP